VTGTVVIGVGNPMRRDDGAGPAVVEALRAEEVDAISLDGEPARLLEAWSGAALAVVVDAVLGDEPGRVRSVEVVRARTVVADLGATAGGCGGTHGAGVAEAVALGAALGRLPDRLALCSVGAADVGHGPGLSPAVAASLPELVALVRTVVGPGVDRRG
jgi:hydrogenase maturation protease